VNQRRLSDPFQVTKPSFNLRADALEHRLSGAGWIHAGTVRGEETRV
jgi:hypothetical protein